MSVMCKHGLYLCSRKECFSDPRRKGRYYEKHSATDCKNATCRTHEVRVVNGMLVMVDYER